MMFAVVLSLLIGIQSAPVKLEAIETIDSNVISLKKISESRAIVFVFLGTECPISNGYSEELNRLALEAGRSKILFIGIYADPDVTLSQAKAHSKEYRLGFPIHFDPKQRWIAATGVKVTPECVVLDSKGSILYRGRIDNRYSEPGKRRIHATTHELEECIKAIVAGKNEPMTHQPAIGCPIPKP
jgi:peroxiredoxin